MNILPYVRKVQFYETDQMGVVHHSNYIHWFEEARVDLMQQMGFPYEEVEARDITFAVLSLSCEYKSPVRFGETVHVFPGVSQCDLSRMAICYRVTDARSGALRTLGESFHFFFRKTDARPVSLKRAIPELYELFHSLKEQGDKAAGAQVL
ncbi:MAG: acyl-CoA thioesterase [Synergistaceae bacterium]|jgi:acyl-CoA thioester hydrolase|nr:acyl-CoA thioesterase [Synergistaceae bacterium]